MSQPSFPSQTAGQNVPMHEAAGEMETQTPEQKAEEARRIRRLQLMVNMVMQVIEQDRSLAVERASSLVADARRAALAMFPDKVLAFDLIFPGRDCSG